VCHQLVGRESGPLVLLLLALNIREFPVKISRHIFLGRLFIGRLLFLLFLFFVLVIGRCKMTVSVTVEIVDKAREKYMEPMATAGQERTAVQAAAIALKYKPQEIIRPRLQAESWTDRCRWLAQDRRKDCKSLDLLKTTPRSPTVFNPKII